MPGWRTAALLVGALVAPGAGALPPAPSQNVDPLARAYTPAPLSLAQLKDSATPSRTRAASHTVQVSLRETLLESEPGSRTARHARSHQAAPRNSSLRVDIGESALFILGKTGSRTVNAFVVSGNINATAEARVATWEGETVRVTPDVSADRYVVQIELRREGSDGAAASVTSRLTMAPNEWVTITERKAVEDGVLRSATPTNFALQLQIRRVH